MLAGLMYSGSLIIAMGMLVLSVISAGLCPGSVRDSEKDLRAHIASEQNPVKKAKYEMRLGRLKLDQAIDAYGQGEVEKGTKLLNAHVEQMRGAWQTLHDSSRNAARQPQGFKELDIALREDERRIEDLKRRISYFDRAPVAGAQKELEDIRRQVLRALFPGLQPSASMNVPGGLALTLWASG
jgi:predicted RNase H-like nuclease (RuvC/YqgF family)